MDKKLKIVKERPTSGQFVRLWEHNNDIWADVVQYKDGNIVSYDRTENDFMSTQAWVKMDEVYVVCDNNENKMNINLNKDDNKEVSKSTIQINMYRDVINTVLNDHYGYLAYNILLTSINIDSCILESCANNPSEEINKIRANIFYDVCMNVINNYDMDDTAEEALVTLVNAVVKFN